MKRMKMILIVVLVAILTLGCLKSENDTLQPSTEAEITPATTSTESSSDSGGLGIFASGAGASTIILTDNAGTTYPVSITVMNMYEETLPSNLVEITNLRYDSVNQKITGEIKSGLSKDIGGVTLWIFDNNINKDLGATQVSLIDKRSKNSPPFEIRSTRINDIKQIKIGVRLPNNYLS